MLNFLDLISSSCKALRLIETLVINQHFGLILTFDLIMGSCKKSVDSCFYNESSGNHKCLAFFPTIINDCWTFNEVKLLS